MSRTPIDSVGATGVARVFFVAGRLGQALYDPQDPRAERRDLDDAAYAIDHFRTKLLHLAGAFCTPTGMRLAQARHARLARFLNDFEDEVGLPREDRWDAAERPSGRGL